MAKFEIIMIAHA